MKDCAITCSCGHGKNEHEFGGCSGLDIRYRSPHACPCKLFKEAREIDSHCEHEKTAECPTCDRFPGKYETGYFEGRKKAIEDFRTVLPSIENAAKTEGVHKAIEVVNKIKKECWLNGETITEDKWLDKAIGALQAITF